MEVEESKEQAGVTGLQAGVTGLEVEGLQQWQQHGMAPQYLVKKNIPNPIRW